MAGRRIGYLAALVGSVIFYIAYQEWFSWLLLLAVLGLPLFSLALSLPAIVTFRGTAAGPDAMEMGTAGTVRLVGTSSLPVPPFRGRLRIRRATTGEQWKQKKEKPLPAEHCGALVITPEKLRVCDYLGLFSIPVGKPAGKTVLVRPVPVKMRGIPDLSRYLARSWRPKFGGGFAENHELRLYRPGDSLNQVHWKLSAKTGKLILREPMEPERGLVLVTMNLRGTAEELDRKFGRLLWLGGYLLDQNIHFEIRALTAEGVQSHPVGCEKELRDGIDALLRQAPAAEGDLRELGWRASWHCHIGGEPDET